MPNKLTIFLFAFALSSSVLRGALSLSPAELSAELESDQSPRLIDIRNARAFAEGHIPGAMNFDLRDLRVGNLPPLGSVVVYGDGLGIETGKKAAEILAERSDLEVRVLAGGYTGWKTAQGRTTEAHGLSSENFNRVTYSRLLEADLSESVLVDLSEAPEAEGASPASLESDPIAGFAREIGVPSTRRDPLAIIPSSNGASPASSGSGPALILVDSNDGSAQEAARRLRARGYHRVLILIGGDETVRFQGKTGKGRNATSISMESDLQ